MITPTPKVIGSHVKYIATESSDEPSNEQWASASTTPVTVDGNGKTYYGEYSPVKKRLMNKVGYEYESYYECCRCLSD